MHTNSHAYLTMSTSRTQFRCTQQPAAALLSGAERSLCVHAELAPTFAGVPCVAFPVMMYCLIGLLVRTHRCGPLLHMRAGEGTNREQQEQVLRGMAAHAHCLIMCSGPCASCVTCRIAARLRH